MDVMDAAAQLDNSPPNSSGYIGRIPVRNLWLLMLYASDLFRSHGLGDLDTEDNPDDIPDLIARVLAEAVEKRLRRQLNLSYRTRHAALNRVRGRIDILTTECHQLLARGRVACHFDELTIDTPRNRFVRAALVTITGVVSEKALAHHCRALADNMKTIGVSGNTPTRAEMRRERFDRNDADDRFMVAAAQLAMDLALPTESTGLNRLSVPERGEKWIRQLFEKAVGGFYEVVLGKQGWRVACGKWLDWPIEKQSKRIGNILPRMKTDIMLDHLASQNRIIIDTKFSAILVRGHYRDQTLRSGYIYQIYAYLRSQVGHGDTRADHATGLLLHPAIGEQIDEIVVMQGHVIRFATVNLAASTADMRNRLLNLVRIDFAGSFNE